MKRILTLTTFLIFSISGKSQVGIGTTTPQANLDIREKNPSTPSAYAGIAIPQVNTLPSAGNRAGQLLFHTINKLYYYWDGSSWISIIQQTVGDVKYGFQKEDHCGWVLLNGRDVNTLSVAQKVAASTLGFTSFLPDARDKFMIGKKALDLGSTTGNSSVTISQANLPLYDLPVATTTTSSNHTHNPTAASESAHTHDAVTDLKGGHDHSRGSTGSVANGGYGLIQATASGNYTTGVLVDFTAGEPNIIFTPRELGLATDGAHTHSFTTNAGSAHTHTITETPTGAHSHTVTVNSGGSGTAISTVPLSIVSNTFIYLGN